MRKMQLKTLETMLFQGYINNIKAKTGKGPEDFKALAEQKNFKQVDG
jgi:hypothetical protein